MEANASKGPNAPELTQPMRTAVLGALSKPLVGCDPANGQVCISTEDRPYHGHLRTPVRARTATADAVLAPDGIVPLYMNPPPRKRQFVRMLRMAGIPAIKANPAAKRGGGSRYFHVASVERLFRQQMGNLPSE